MTDKELLADLHKVLAEQLLARIKYLQAKSTDFFNLGTWAANLR